MKLLWRFFSLFLAGAAAASVSHAASDTSVIVEIRSTASSGEPVVEKYALYGASHALVIGIDNYTNGWPRLSNAVKDAKLVAAALEAKGFEVQLLLDPDGETLRRSLRHFYAVTGRDPEARLFVWYAGHGHTEFGEGYLVPADGPLPEDPEFLLKALHMGDIGSMVKIARAKHALAVFDSCFAGTVFDSQRARPPAAITKVAARPVRQFLTSGDADQQVSDNGSFRQLFIDSLNGEEAADLNNDGYLTGTELGLHLENRVTNLTRAAQTPRSGKLRDPRFDRGDFIFVLPKQQAGLPAATPDTDDRAYELAFWDSIKSSRSPEDYEAYLEAYPKGRFVPLAKARVRVLTAKRASPDKTLQAPDKTSGAEPKTQGSPEADQAQLRRNQDTEAAKTSAPAVAADPPKSERSTAATLGTNQQANLPPPERSMPLTTAKEVTRQIKGQGRAFALEVIEYAKRRGLITAGAGLNYPRISEIDVIRVEADRAVVRLYYIVHDFVGHYGNHVFDLRWEDDKLVVAGDLE